ncbi:MAG: DUF1080 domain-containing protein [Planctomycetaceae bacterium]
MSTSTMTRVTMALGLIALGTSAVSAAEPDKDGFISLFNGKDLTGWKVGDADQSEFRVEDGKIVARGKRSHVFTEQEFKNFDFKAEVMTTPGSNSGIYFHSKFQEKGFPDHGHEVQVNVSQGDPVKTGSIYNIVKLYETPAKDNEWWEQEIIVKGQNVVVKINGKVVLDYTEPIGPQNAVVKVNDKVVFDDTIGPKVGRKISRGCFALQAHDPKSVTYYRNIRVKPLPE